MIEPYIVHPPRDGAGADDRTFTDAKQADGTQSTKPPPVPPSAQPGSAQRGAARHDPTARTSPPDSRHRERNLVGQQSVPRLAAREKGDGEGGWPTDEGGAQRGTFKKGSLRALARTKMERQEGTPLTRKTMVPGSISFPDTSSGGSIERDRAARKAGSGATLASSRNRRPGARDTQTPWVTWLE